VHSLKYITRLRKWKKHLLERMRDTGRHVARGYQRGKLADNLRGTQIVGGITSTIQNYMLDVFTPDAVLASETWVDLVRTQEL
jgi:hypothetical protein